MMEEICEKKVYDKITVAENLYVLFADGIFCCHVFKKENLRTISRTPKEEEHSKTSVSAEKENNIRRK